MSLESHHPDRGIVPNCCFRPPNKQIDQKLLDSMKTLKLDKSERKPMNWSRIA